MTDDELRCSSCTTVKPREAFYKDRTKTGGWRSVCKACDLQRSKAYYLAHRERVQERCRLYQRERAKQR